MCQNVDFAETAGANSRQPHLPGGPLGCTLGSGGGSPNTLQRADLSRRIFSLVDVIASLIPVIMVVEISIPGNTVGFEGEVEGRSPIVGAMGAPPITSLPPSEFEAGVQPSSEPLFDLRRQPTS